MMPSRHALFVCLLCAGSASANMIGNASIGFGQVGLSAFGSDFYSSSGSQCDQPGPGAGCFYLVSGTGTFAAHTAAAPQANAIKDLSSQPFSGAVNIPTFMSFDNGAINFDLTYIAPAAAQDCSTAGNLSAPNLSCALVLNSQVSPWLLTNGPQGDTISVAATMYFDAWESSNPSAITAYLGIFSTQMAGVNIASLFSTISTGGTAVNAWSASFAPVPNQAAQSATPEPSTFMLLCAAALTIALCRHRRA
jgi:hypothetical protein